MGFELLTTKTTVKPKKKHHNSVLRDSLKLVFFLVFYSGFGCCSGFSVVFLGYYSGFRLLSAKTTVEIRKTMNFHDSQT